MTPEAGALDYGLYLPPGVGAPTEARGRSAEADGRPRRGSSGETPDDPRTRTVAVLLHGRGADKDDLLALGGELGHDVVIVTPEAPHPGAPWGYGPGRAWYRYVADDRVVSETLDASVVALDRFLGALPEVLGFEPDRLFLGGFSQGGTTSLTFALRKPGKVHGVLNFSGFLPDGERLERAPATPVFWGHGARDPAIPFSLAERGRARLEAAGTPLGAYDYDIGHWIAPEELADAKEWMQNLAP